MQLVYIVWAIKTIVARSTVETAADQWSLCG